MKGRESHLEVRKAHSEVQKVHLEVQEGSGLEGPPGGTGVVERPPGVPEGPPRGPEEVRCPTRLSRRGWETLPVGWEMSEGPSGSLGVVRRSMWRVGRGREVHPDVRKGLVGPIGGQEGVGRLTRWTEWC